MRDGMGQSGTVNGRWRNDGVGLCGFTVQASSTLAYHFITRPSPVAIMTTSLPAISSTLPSAFV